MQPEAPSTPSPLSESAAARPVCGHRSRAGAARFVLALVPLALAPTLLAGSSVGTANGQAAARTQIRDLVGAQDHARIEVLEGRAQLITAERVETLIEREPPLRIESSGHLIVRAATRLRMTWPGRASVLVHGPAALEWRSPESRDGRGGTSQRPSHLDVLELAVVELGEFEVEVRRGTLQLSLPDSWQATLSGVAVQLTARPSGAVEFVHHAGPAVELQWIGERSASRPPVRIPAGSSVRLARPKHSPREPLAESRRAPWPADADEWPWRVESDTPELRAARLAQPRRTERPEGWASGRGDAAIGPWVSHVEAFDADGRVRLLPVAAAPGASPRPDVESGGGAVDRAALARARRRMNERKSGATSAQVPAVAQPTRVTLEPLPEPEEQSAEPEPVPPVESERANESVPPSGSPSVGPGAPVTLPSSELRSELQSVPTPRVDSAEDRTPAVEPAPGEAPPDAPSTAPEPAANDSPTPSEEPSSFDAADWRGLPRSALEGVGPVAVQRRPGVEVRALSAGRVRVLVDAAVPGPVWCFAPGRDLRLAPGATIVFEADGRDRMRLGAIESFEASPDRLRWDELTSR